MKAYNFTDSDLDAISLSNIVSVTGFALGSAVATFCIDVKKDLIIAPAEELSTKAEALVYSVNFFGLPISAVLLLVGLIALFYRGNIIKRVKNESQSTAK